MWPSTSPGCLEFHCDLKSLLIISAVICYWSASLHRKVPAHYSFYGSKILMFTVMVFHGCSQWISHKPTIITTLTVRCSLFQVKAQKWSSKHCSYLFFFNCNCIIENYKNNWAMNFYVSKTGTNSVIHEYAVSCRWRAWLLPQLMPSRGGGLYVWLLSP